MSTLTTEYLIGAHSDDAYDREGELFLGTTPFAGWVNGVEYVGGFRFTGVQTLRFRLHQAIFSPIRRTIEGTPNITLWGVADANPETWADVTNMPSDAPLTTASVNIGDASANAYDVTAIFQEILALPGWAGGNAVAFVARGEEPPSGIHRVGWWDHSSGLPHPNRAKLTVTWRRPARHFYWQGRVA